MDNMAEKLRLVKLGVKRDAAKHNHQLGQFNKRADGAVWVARCAKCDKDATVFVVEGRDVWRTGGEAMICECSNQNQKEKKV